MPYLILFLPLTAKLPNFAIKLINYLIDKVLMRLEKDELFAKSFSLVELAAFDAACGPYQTRSSPSKISGEVFFEKVVTIRGLGRTRTAYLFVANEAFYRLNYEPPINNKSTSRGGLNQTTAKRKKLCFYNLKFFSHYLNFIHSASIIKLHNCKALVNTR